MTPGSVFIITGPPGAGKSTVSGLLLARFARGLHLKVDDLRTSVVQGLSDSLGWNDETERQFQIAEDASCRVARCYSDAGFAVAFDHCRNIPRMNQVAQDHLAGAPVVKVCLLPSLETTLERNRARGGKSFDTVLLEDIIRGTHQGYSQADTTGWLMLDSSDQSPEETAGIIAAWAEW